MSRVMAARVAVTLALALGLASIVAACDPGDGTPPQIPLAQPVAPGKCAEWTGQPVERTCIPRMAQAGAPLDLEIEERCGACGTTAERCTVSLIGHVLTFSLDGKTCEPPAGAACRDVCGKNRVRCQVPPLDEGRYEIRYGDTSRQMDTFDVVHRRDAATVCALDDANGR